MAHKPFIEIKARTVKITKNKQEREYTEIDFTKKIDPPRFREFTSQILHVNDCVWSDGVGKWFCPTDNIGWIMKQAETFFDEGELEQKEVGELIAEAYGEKKTAKRGRK